MLQDRRELLNLPSKKKKKKRPLNIASCLVKEHEIDSTETLSFEHPFHDLKQSVTINELDLLQVGQWAL